MIYAVNSVGSAVPVKQLPRFERYRLVKTGRPVNDKYPSTFSYTGNDDAVNDDYFLDTDDAQRSLQLLESGHHLTECSSIIATEIKSQKRDGRGRKPKVQMNPFAGKDLTKSNDPDDIITGLVRSSARAGTGHRGNGVLKALAYRIIHDLDELSTANIKLLTNYSDRQAREYNHLCSMAVRFMMNRE